MNYSRYWDLHLCSTTFTDDDLKKATTDFFTHRGTQYRYDFLKDMRKQAEYREGKKEGYESGAWASLWSRENMRVLDSSELTNSRKSFLVPPPQGGISEELSRLRYVSCLVSIEKLKESAKNPQVRYPQLQSLVRWIADNQTINKLRINCHGSGDSKSGFSMGGKLSPAELFDALVHHGLTIAPKTVQNLTGLAHAARWKRDNEVEACEKCKKQFSVLRRRHHCRRCGGIFCETCSSWKVDLVVALAGESNKTVPNVKNARVCQQCYEDAIAAMAAREVGWAAERSDLQGNETIYGLKQVTLALCMGAMTEHGFSQEHGKVGQVAIAQGANATGAHGGFVAGSLAHRLLAELRRHRLLGIKVTASNQVVSGGTGQIQNQLGVEYPTDTYDGLGTNYKSFKDSSSFDFPARVWGSSTILKRVWDAKAKTGPADLPSSYKIELFSDGRSLTFGASRQNSKAFAWLQTDFLHEWSFKGWGIRHGVIYSAPSPSARNADDTLVITPPPRVATVAVRNDSKNQSRVFLTSRAGVDSFKDYKSYGVS